MKNVTILVGNKIFDAATSIKKSIAFLGEVCVAMLKALRHPTKIRWNETIYYLNMCGIDGIPIVMLICFLMGAILGIQSAIILTQWGTEVFMADMIGLSIIKELGALMVSIIATGRAGSAFAAEIGTMKVNEEVDAMITMGLEPSRFLIVPKVIAMAIAMPILTLFGNLAGVLGGFCIGYLKLDIPAITYYNRTVGAVAIADLLEGLIKVTVFGIIITIIGCMRGFEASNDAQSVGRSATSAVVTSIFWVIIADAILTILFNFVR